MLSGRGGMRRADHSSRGVLPSDVCVCVCNRDREASIMMTILSQGVGGKAHQNARSR